MPEEDSTQCGRPQRKRPERQLYVPPAQRQKNNTKHRKEKRSVEKREPNSTQILAIKWERPRPNYCKLMSISDFVNFLHNYHFIPFNCDLSSSNELVSDELNDLPKIVIRNKRKFVQLLHTYRDYNYFESSDIRFDCDLFRFDTNKQKTDYNYLLTRYNLYDNCEFLRLMKQFEEYNNVDRICHYFNANNAKTQIHDDDVVIKINQSHIFFVKSSKIDAGYFYECNQGHNINKCYEAFKEELRSEDDDLARESLPAAKSQLDLDKRKLIDGKERRKMRENLTKCISKRTRRVIKFVANDEEDTNKDNLLLDVKVDDWEELYSSDAENDMLKYERKNDARRDTQARKWQEESHLKPSTSADDDFSHVVEVYDFPPTFRTQDIMQMFSHMNCESMYIKWIDDTHALLVFATPSQAKKAAEYENPLLKVRVISEASPVALNILRKSDLKPALKRPQTSLQTARRLITTHLGTRSGISPEQNQKEREILRTARERKRQARQTEKDAWEGNFDSKK